MSRATLLAFLLLATVGLVAQNKQPKRADQEKSAEALKAFQEETSLQGTDRSLQMYGVDAFPCENDTADEPVHKSCLAARQAYYEYYVKGLPRRSRVYEWNNFSTKVIFFVVLSLVAVGIYFSWKQFFGMTVTPTTEDGGAKGERTEKSVGQQLMTELEMGLAGIKVKSPILGVILLTVSLAFFYLYLKYVYPVTNSF